MSKYTFLLPAYKAKYFEEALGSILSQTYEDFDVIVSDDCSPEDLKSVVDKFSDPRVTYRRNERNIGAEHLVDHWNLLLGLTDADYIVMASDDDIFDKGYLQEIDEMVLSNTDAVVFRPRIRKIDKNGSLLSEEGPLPHIIDEPAFLELWGRNVFMSGIPYYVFNRKKLLEAGGFADFPFAWFSDDATVLKALCGRRMSVSDKVLFSFRISNKNISGTISPDSAMGKVNAAIMFYFHLMERKDHFSKKAYEAAVNRIRSTTRDIIVMCRPDDSKRLIRMTKPLFPIRWRIGLYKQYFIDKCSRSNS